MFIQQLSLLSLYAVYNSGDHLVMTTVFLTPFVLLAILHGVVCGGVCCAGCAGGAVTYNFISLETLMGDRAQKIAACFFCLMCCFVCVLLPIVILPLIGYSIYNLNFLWQTNSMGGNVMEGKEFFTIDWPSTVDTLGSVSKAVVGANVCDLLLDSFLEVLFG